MKETTEFIYLQQKQLKAKEDYYVNCSPTLTDFQFDMLEKQSYEIARKLSFRADKHLGPEENEEHHIHWMIGFSKNSRYYSYNLLDLSL